MYRASSVVYHGSLVRDDPPAIWEQGNNLPHLSLFIKQSSGSNGAPASAEPREPYLL